MAGKRSGRPGIGQTANLTPDPLNTTQREFAGAFAVTLHLLERVFGKTPEGSPWREAARQARRAWDLSIRSLPQSTQGEVLFDPDDLGS